MRRAGCGDVPCHSSRHAAQIGKGARMKWVLGLFVLPLLATDGPRLVYSKSFPGSVPAFVEVAIERNGDAQYKEAPDDDQPLKFQLAEADTTEIFGLVEKLGRFTHPLEAPLKV